MLDYYSLKEKLEQKEVEVYNDNLFSDETVRKNAVEKAEQESKYILNKIFPNY